MEEQDPTTDMDILNKLRGEYLEALQLGDDSRINDVIAPEFWERFGGYYQEFARGWKDLSLAQSPVQVVLDPRKQRDMDHHWMDQVLRGNIEIPLSTF